MQIAACPMSVKIDDIPNQIVQKEKKLKWVGMICQQSQITSKIVQGRIEKRLKEMTLMDQSYIRDQNITVEELEAERSNSG